MTPETERETGSGIAEQANKALNATGAGAPAR
jgi:hypothetical protein